MYFVRIVFFEIEGVIFDNISDTAVELFKENNHRCTIKKKKQGEKTKIIIEYGAFDTKDKADIEGSNLLRNIKIEMCKQGCPINISGISGILDCEQPFVMPGEFTKGGIAYIRLKLIQEGRITKDKHVLEDVLGLAIYEVKKYLNEIHFISQDFKIIQHNDFNLKFNRYKEWNEKLDIAVSLLSTSSLINDIRMKFLLKIMSIEVLVANKEYEEEKYKNAIENIIKNVNDYEFEDQINNRIKNDLGNLKKKSIGSKCYGLIVKYCSDKKYNNKDAIAFFKQCYSIRSSFVHAGTMNTNEMNECDSELRKLVIDVLLGYQKYLNQR